MGKIYYLMGKSASGKDHIYENLIQETALDLKPFVLYTTRPIRSGEQDGREYFFVDEKRLSELREAGKIIEERMYSTVQGPWYYFTADDGQIDLAKHDYLGIGTLESYLKLKAYFGEQAMVPLYVEVDDGLRLSRALERERKQTERNTRRCAGDSWRTVRILRRRKLRKLELSADFPIILRRKTVFPKFRILWNNRKSCDILNAVLVRNTKELQGVILCRVFRRL